MQTAKSLPVPENKASTPAGLLGRLAGGGGGSAAEELAVLREGILRIRQQLSETADQFLMLVDKSHDLIYKFVEIPVTVSGVSSHTS